MRKHINIIERIERAANELRDDECWTTSLTSKVKGGYVLITANRTETSDPHTTVLMHRIAWEAHNAEPIPEGMVVMHTCDNPECFNPHHLRLGTQSENMRDCVAKGRHKPGPGRPQQAA